MTLRKSLLSMLAGAALLAGCASGPYYDYPYERTGYYEYPTTYYAPYDYYAYGPGYYVAPPVVSFGLTYSDRHYYRGPRRWG